MRLTRFPAPIVVLAFLMSSPSASAQTAVVQPLNTDADALATQMRIIGASPQNVAALVTAGELSLKLDDLAAAASFFARAEKVDPRNARMKAGEATLLIRSERPGEALRYFAQAQSYGGDPRSFAGDRGLAYDLIGEQERAQRDYRLALKSRVDDETVRRYALSLGISGKREAALAQLDPLVRKSDRGAWRARAFILAMTGDVGGAEKIATTMMPGGARGLQAFFDRLPTLPAIDRAFAVHFGEVRATRQRIADARLAPTMTPLPPEAGVPVQLASVTPAPAARPSAKRDKRKDKRSDRQTAKLQPGRTQLAQVPIPAAAKVELPSRPPVYRAAVPAPTPAPVALAQASPARAPASSPALPQTRQPPSTTPRQAIPSSTAPQTQVATAASAQPGFDTATRAAVPITPAAEARLDAAARAPSATPGFSSGSIAPGPTPSTAAPIEIAKAEPVPVAATPPTSVARAGEDAILARIVAGISIPASELGVTEPARAVAPVPVAQAAPVSPVPAPAPAEPEASRLAAEKLAADKRAADRKLVADKKRAADKLVADKKLAAEKTAADKKLATEKAATDKKALAAKKAAADKKALADKAAAEEKKAAKADPERIWVQVAGGAYEGDLPKAWAAVKKKAPEAFAGHQGYTTPLRATNRVVTGPFKTDAEARAFVNALAKKGVSGFTFTSDKGQKVARLPAK